MPDADGPALHPIRDMYDAVVVGGGPAGLAAATWLARYRRRTLLVDGGEQRNRWVEQAHGYLGSDPMSPRDFLERSRLALLKYAEVEVRENVRVVDVAGQSGDFVVTLDDGRAVSGCRLVLATGVRDAFPDIDGFFDHYGASVFHCPTCDGYETAGLDVVAIGWNEHVAGFALTLLDWAASVTILTEGVSFQGDEEHRAALERNGVDVIEAGATGFVGQRGDLRAVRLASGDELRAQVAFFSIAHHPRNDLAVQLGCAVTEEGCVQVDSQNRTTVEGVYACGDLTPGIQLVQVAASKGAVAGVACAQSLRGEAGAPASPVPGPDPEEEVAAGEG